MHLFGKQEPFSYDIESPERLNNAKLQKVRVCFFCYCVLSEMQTLQRIFLWAVNV